MKNIGEILYRVALLVCQGDVLQWFQKKEKQLTFKTINNDLIYLSIASLGLTRRVWSEGPVSE